MLPVARSLPSDGVPRDGAEYLLAVRYATACHPRLALLAPAIYEFRSDSQSISCCYVQDDGGETPFVYESSESIL